MIKQSRSEAFLANARLAGFSEDQLKVLPKRLLEYGKAGNVHYTLSPVSRIGSDGIAISRWGTRGHVWHEMGDLLDDIKRPGLFARESSLTYREIVSAERTATVVQLGNMGWRTTVVPHLAAIEAKTGLVTISTIGGVAWGGTTVYDAWWGERR